MYGILVPVILLIACNYRPTLRVTNSKEGLRFDVQTLGEYPSSICRIRLTEESGNVLWEIKAKSGDNKGCPQIWTFDLISGTNDPIPKNKVYGEYDILWPKDGKPFLLAPKKKYKIEIWGSSARWPRTYVFSIPAEK